MSVLRAGSREMGTPEDERWCLEAPVETWAKFHQPGDTFRRARVVRHQNDAAGEQCPKDAAAPGEDKASRAEHARHTG